MNNLPNKFKFFCISCFSFSRWRLRINFLYSAYRLRKWLNGENGVSAKVKYQTLKTLYFDVYGFLGRLPSNEERDNIEEQIQSILSRDISQEAKDVISVSAIFQRDDLTEDEVKQARLELDRVMKKLVNRKGKDNV